MKPLLDIISAHKQGQPIGVYSVCSAHPLVLEAALCQAKQDNQLVLIEATTNQVNQYGGYTGMTPSDFAKRVFELADSISFPHGNIVLGGDHLGPNCRPTLKTRETMAPQIGKASGRGRG